MNTLFLSVVIGVIIWFTKLQARHVHFLHMAQLEKYQISDYIFWISRNKKQLPDYKEIYFTLALIFTGLWCIYLNLTKAEILLVMLWVTGTIYLFFRRDRLQDKKKLVFTPRAIRLFITSNFLFLYLTFDILFRIFSSTQYPTILVIFIIISAQIMYQLAFYFILLGLLINYPIETVINKYYFQSAKHVIRKSKTSVIGITGSYGKTSVKDILCSLLSIKYKTLKTPESYNTPMGICKIIRRDLKQDYDFFVVEMGARRSGEIKELCNLVKPVTGIITAIGPQHLKTFGSLESISETKYELIKSLPENGTAVLNGDDPICAEMANKRFLKKTILFGIDFEIPPSSFTKRGGGGDYTFIEAKNITIDSEGSSFILKNGQSEIEIKSHLLGYQNIYNILAATAVALHYGLTLQEVKTVVKDLKPIPHRLQLIKNPNGIIIIDDAFNSNPVGARMALDVLRSFKGGKKTLVTPGLVELGEIEYEENKKLGEKAASICDYVIVVGKTQSKPIIAGLEEKGFSSDKIKNVHSLDKVSQYLQTILKPNDIVLFENDLPDNYL